nr:unnamed protein product [Callosobruchus chinensis]
MSGLFKTLLQRAPQIMKIAVPATKKTSCRNFFASATLLNLPRVQQPAPDFSGLAATFNDKIKYYVVFDFTYPNGILRYITVNDLPIGRSVDEALRLIEAIQFVEEQQTGGRDKILLNHKLGSINYKLYNRK